MLNLLGLYGAGARKDFSLTEYEGTGAAQSIVTGVGGFSTGGFAWLKNLDSSDSHYLFDTVNAATNYTTSDTNAAQATDANSLTSFNGGGFSVGTSTKANDSGDTFTSLSWAEREGYMDIVSYTGSGSNQSVAHSLGVAPKFALVKDLDATADWAVWHPSIDVGLDRYILELNNADARVLSTTAFQQTAPDSTNLYVGANTQTNANTNDYIAYLFAEVAGSSKFGSYAGNGGSQSITGIGFKPTIVLIKDVGNSVDWTLMWERTAGSVTYIRPNTSDIGQNTSNAQITDDGWDFSAGGFQNTTSRTYIYAAWK